MSFHTGKPERVSSQVAAMRHQLLEVRRQSGQFSNDPDSAGHRLLAAVELLAKRQETLLSELGYGSGSDGKYHVV